MQKNNRTDILKYVYQDLKSEYSRKEKNEKANDKILYYFCKLIVISRLGMFISTTME